LRESNHVIAADPLFDEAESRKGRLGGWMTRGTRFLYLAEWGLFSFGLFCLLFVVPLTLEAWNLASWTWLLWFIGIVATPFLFPLFSVLMEMHRQYAPLEVYRDSIQLQTTFSERREGLGIWIPRSEIASVRVLRGKPISYRRMRSADIPESFVESDAPNELVITMTNGQVRRTGKRRPNTIRTVAAILESWGVAVIDDN
jgi:hypothetical protein